MLAHHGVERWIIFTIRPAHVVRSALEMASHRVITFPSLLFGFSHTDTSSCGGRSVHPGDMTVAVKVKMGG